MEYRVMQQSRSEETWEEAEVSPWKLKIKANFHLGHWVLSMTLAAQNWKPLETHKNSHVLTS
jgi:hypothetical protein